MKIRSSYAVLTRFGIIAAVLAALVFIAPVASAAEMFTYPEGTVSVATFSATDADEDDIVWGLAGDDKGAFKITPSDDGMSAELAFKECARLREPCWTRGRTIIYKVKVTASIAAAST